MKFFPTFIFWLLLSFTLTSPLLSQQFLKPTLPDPRFDFLFKQTLTNHETDSSFSATIRFKEKPSLHLIRQIEAQGVRFLTEKDPYPHRLTVFPVELKFAHLPYLLQIPDILSIQPAWRPFRTIPLDVSRPQIQADCVWARTDMNGFPLTGKGILIANFDTGVDFFHPMLFFADGDTLNWIDVNGNNLFDPGTDAVDLNRNNLADAGEILRYREMTYSGSGNTNGLYDTHLDFLYNDANNNNNRDYGVNAGFNEQSPTYGEQWLITLDANKDNRLSPGEKLVGLKTSKIRAIRETDGTVRRRGIDLIHANPDTGPYGGHGTSVAGIAIGGIAGVHKAAGIAPGAEMIVASIAYNSAPRFFTGLAPMIVWAYNEGAQVMLYEDGEWAWEYLDGSSNEEILINEMAQNGVVQVIPAGNLTGGYMQKTLYLNPGDSITASFNGNSASQIWPSIRWSGEINDIVIRLQVGTGAYATLPCDGSTLLINGKNVYSNIGVSSRGTVMAIIHITPASATSYTFRFVNQSGVPKRIEGMLADDGFSWTGWARWVSPSETNTITWPATADSSIGVGAYKNKQSNTDINSFSGRGVRLDNTTTLVIAAPGSTVYSIGRNATYTAFGGTSAAGPHVAAAAALLLQANPFLGHSGVKALLKSGAISDAFTGTVPNTTWGYGKLRILNSLLPLLSTDQGTPPIPAQSRLYPNYPNPFNPSTVIRYQLAESDRVTLKIYNTLGQEVRTLDHGQKTAGWHQIIWDGRDQTGRAVSSGIYILRLQSKHFSQSRKMILIR